MHFPFDPRGWLSRSEADSRFAGLWDYALAQTAATTAALERLGNRMTSVETQTWDELGRLVGVIVAEVSSLREGIAQKDEALQTALDALDAADAAAAEQVRTALDADSAADAERVVGLTDRLKSVLPGEVTVPDVPVPAVGEPAQEPDPATPTDGASTDGAPTDSPVPADGTTDVVNPTPNPDEPATPAPTGEVDENGNPVSPSA